MNDNELLFLFITLFILFVFANLMLYITIQEEKKKDYEIQKKLKGWDFFVDDWQKKEKKKNSKWGW